jgi:perosamine synthetase
MKKKVLITGGSGLLGINIAVLMRDNWDIHLLYRSRIVVMDKISVSCVDLTDFDELITHVENTKPDIIIHAAGLTNVEKCEDRYFDAYESNVVASRNVAKICKVLRIKLVHISTDHFSDSNIQKSDESQISIPVNNYAKTKLDAEYEIIKYSSDPLIVRTNFYGWGHKFRTSFSDFIITSLRKKENITLFEDVFYSPIYVGELIRSIDELIETEQSGIFNIVGNERISKFEFGCQVAKVFDLDQSLISPGSIADHEGLSPRPLDMSMSNDKLKAASIIILDTIASLELLKQQEFEGVATTIKQSVTCEEFSQIHYGKQSIDEDDINAVINTLNGNFLTQGPTVKIFEEKVAAFVGAKYAVAVSNWTCGLHITCLAAGVGPGDTVITSPLSFVASSNCAVFSGAIPAFADINLETLNIDPESVEKKCKELGNVKAIIPVHFAGHPCNMKELKEIADKYGAVIIEDAAHAIGGQYLEGGMIGSCTNSLMSGFSFHPVKNIATGEGSVITTNDNEIYKQLLRLRSHGIVKGNDPFIKDDLSRTDGCINSWYYEMQQLGYNYRITDIQCSLGISQLKKLPNFVKRRIAITKFYDEKLTIIPHVKIVQNKTREISGNHLYVALIDYEKVGKSRNQVYKELREFGINAHVHYIPIPLQPYYSENYDIPKEDYKYAMDYYDQAITLPLYPSMTDESVDHVINSLSRVLSE